MKKHHTLKKVAAAVALLLASLRPMNVLAAGPITAVAVSAPVKLPAGLPVLPTGLSVVNGSAALSQSGNNLQITTAPNSVLDWQQFSIGAGNSVYFQQANAGSQVLNRVTGQDPSYILGSLGSNGRVWLLNPNGVLFGANARVDVGSLVASTLSLKLPDFLSGNYQLRAGSSAAANTLGVINQGQISTPFGGQIVLAANRVENSGTLQAPGGNVALLGTNSVDLTDTGLPYLGFKVTQPYGSVSSSGTVQAKSVDMYAGVVNQLGLVKANSLGVDDKGQIVLSATGTLTVQGTLDASGVDSAVGNSGQAGNIALTGQTVDVQAGARLTADAATQGNGGRIILWSDTDTIVKGQITARGGQQGGNGGFIETSSHGQLHIDTVPDASAPKGQGGTWLLDPNNITIQATGPNANVTAGPNFASTADSAVVSTASIEAALNAGTNVSVTTSAGGVQAGDINVNGAISKTGGGNATLTLTAHNNINLNSNITSTVGALNLTLVSDSDLSGAGQTQLGNGTTFALNGGSFIATGGGGKTTASSGTATLIATAQFGTLNLTGATLVNSGPVAMTVSTLNVTNGTLSGLAGTTVTGALTGGGLSLDATTLTNQGSATLTNTNSNIINGSRLVNDTSGTYSMTYASIDGNTGTGNVFENRGVLQAQKTATAPYAGFFNGVALQNTGTVNVNSGSLLLLPNNSGATEILGGAINVADGATLRLDSGTHQFTSSGVLNLNNTGLLNLTSGTLNSGPSAFSVKRLDVASGTVTGAGGFVVTNSLTGNGLSLDATTLTNQGAATLTGTSITNASRFINDTSGTFSMTNTSVNGFTGTGNVLENRGVLQAQTTGTGSNSISGAALQNTGTVNVNSGTLSLGLATGNDGVLSLASGSSLSASAGFTNSAAGTVQGFGTLNVGSSTFANNGTLAPGSATTIGTLAVTGKYVQGPSGTLLAKVASPTSFDQLQISGAATLGGSLAVSGLNYTPVTTDTFNVVTYPSFTGAFSSVSASNVPVPGVSYTTNAVVLSEAPAPAPAPAAIIEVVNPVFASNLIRPTLATQVPLMQVESLVLDGDVVDVSSTDKFDQLLARSNPISGNQTSTATPTGQNAISVDPFRFLMADGQSSFFKDMQVAQMSRPELASVLDARKAYKKQIFSTATQLAEVNMTIADVKSCESTKDALEGLCAITPSQRDALRAQAAAQLVGGSSADFPVPGITRKRALVIGLDKYTDKRIPQLVSPVYDARSISEAFGGQLGYDVTLLQNPTKAEIVKWFNRIVVELNDTNSFVVYFAGHGELVEKTKMGYWIPGDASASDPSTWISNNDISRWLANVNSKQVAVIADSCYSGTLAVDLKANSAALVSNVADDYLRKRTITVMSSGSDEPVADTGKFGHSVFAWNLLEEIKGLKSWSVGASVFSNVRTQVERELPQTPSYGVSTSAGHEEGGDFLFERRSKIK